MELSVTYITIAHSVDCPFGFKSMAPTTDNNVLMPTTASVVLNCVFFENAASFPNLNIYIVKIKVQRIRNNMYKTSPLHVI